MQFNLDRAVDVLRRTPATLASLLDGIDETWAKTNEGPDTFSPFDVVGHLIDGEESDWIPRARIILGGGNSRVFQPFDRFRHKARNVRSGLEALLEEFTRLRSENLRTLESWSITESDLEQTGEHPAFGEVTLRQLLSTWVVHDLGHIAQISRVMAKQYRRDVGPWEAYLPVLSDRPVPAS